MMFCRRESLGRYSRGTEASGKFFSWRWNSSLWTRLWTFCLEVKIRSPRFQASPPEATRKRLAHLLALDLVWPQTDSLFQGPEKRVFGPIVYLDLFVVGVTPSTRPSIVAMTPDGYTLRWLSLKGNFNSGQMRELLSHRPIRLAPRSIVPAPTTEPLLVIGPYTAAPAGSGEWALAESHRNELYRSPQDSFWRRAPLSSRSAICMCRDPWACCL